MKDIPIHLKDTLRSLRIKFGYTQEEGAKLLGVTSKTLRAWEKNSEKVPYLTIKKIEKAYGVSQDYIFFGREDSFSELLRRKMIS